MATGIANSPLVNYFRYKQSTSISAASGLSPLPILSIADAGNGQLLITTSATTNMSAGVAVMFAGMSIAAYDGDYSVISFTATTFNVSGVFVGTSTGTWEFASAISAGVAGELADFGTIAFFNATNKTVPQDTFEDRDLTVPNTNPIVLDSVGSHPPIYLQQIPYFVEIRDKFNNIIETLENYLPFDADEVQDFSNIENLFSSYGFDSIIDNGDYENNSLPLNTPDNPVSAGWFWEITTSNSASSNTYFFNELLASFITGNPKNELVLRSTNNSAGDTINNLFCTIGDYQSLQDRDLSFSIFIRRLAGGVSSLQVAIRRSESGVNQTPINVGVIPVSATRQQQIFTFNIGALIAGTYINSDVLDLIIQLPLNEDFEVGITGSWLQLADSPDATAVDISEIPISQSEARQYFGNAFRKLQAVNTFDSLGLPLIMNGGSSDVANMTGSYFIGKGSYNTATDMGTFPGTLLVRDNPLGLTSTNRLIDYLRSNAISQSRLTLLTSVLGTMVMVSPGIGDTQQATPVANAGGRVTITNTNAVQQYGLIAKIDNIEVNKLNLTFTANFDASTNPFQTAPTSYAVQPDSSPFINWFGLTSADVVLNSLITTKIAFFEYFPVENVQNGDGSNPAIVNVMFHDNEKSLFKDIINIHVTPAFDFTFSRDTLIHNYFNQTFSVRSIGSANTTTFTTGFFSYNDIGTNPDPQPDPPPRVIRYSVDSDAGSASPTGTVSTLVISVNSGDNAQKVCLKSSNAINEPWEETIEIVSTPDNGDYVTLPIASDEFIVIFWDTAQAQPANPLPADIPIYVQFTVAEALTTIAQSTSDSIDESHVGIPYWPDLGLPAVDEENMDLSHFIVN